MALERVYEAFLHAMQAVGSTSWDDVDNANKEYHQLMNKLDYNCSCMNQVQDLTIDTPDNSIFEALYCQYMGLAQQLLDAAPRAPQQILATAARSGGCAERVAAGGARCKPGARDSHHRAAE